MNLEKVANILRTAPLDRRLKIQIINILAFVEDKEAQEDFVLFLQDWHESAESSREDLKQELTRILKTYGDKVDRLKRKADNELNEMEDLVDTGQKIEEIRKKIKSE